MTDVLFETPMKTRLNVYNPHHLDTPVPHIYILMSYPTHNKPLKLKNFNKTLKKEMFPPNCTRAHTF